MQIQWVRPTWVYVNLAFGVYTEIHLQGCTERVLFHSTMAVLFTGSYQYESLELTNSVG